MVLAKWLMKRRSYSLFRFSLNYRVGHINRHGKLSIWNTRLIVLTQSEWFSRAKWHSWLSSIFFKIPGLHAVIHYECGVESINLWFLHMRKLFIHTRTLRHCVFCIIFLFVVIIFHGQNAIEAKVWYCHCFTNEYNCSFVFGELWDCLQFHIPTLFFTRLPLFDDLDVIWTGHYVFLLCLFVFCTLQI